MFSYVCGMDNFVCANAQTFVEHLVEVCAPGGILKAKWIIAWWTMCFQKQWVDDCMKPLEHDISRKYITPG